MVPSSPNDLSLARAAVKLFVLVERASFKENHLESSVAEHICAWLSLSYSTCLHCPKANKGKGGERGESRKAKDRERINRRRRAGLMVTRPKPEERNPKKRLNSPKQPLREPVFILHPDFRLSECADIGRLTRSLYPKTLNPQTRTKPSKPSIFTIQPTSATPF